MEESLTENTNNEEKYIQKSIITHSTPYYKKIKIKPLKNKTSDYIINEIKNENLSSPKYLVKSNRIETEDNFKFKELNNQLDDILESIENDGVDEVTQKLKLLKEDNYYSNKITYFNDYKKIDNNKYGLKKKMKDKIHKYNKIINKNNKNMNKNISNCRYLFSDLNNSYKIAKEENNCVNYDNDYYCNKSNISLFYKYNKNNYSQLDKNNNFFES